MQTNVYIYVISWSNIANLKQNKSDFQYTNHIAFKSFLRDLFWIASNEGLNGKKFCLTFLWFLFFLFFFVWGEGWVGDSMWSWIITRILRTTLQWIANLSGVWISEMEMAVRMCICTRSTCVCQDSRSESRFGLWFWPEFTLPECKLFQIRLLKCKKGHFRSWSA